VERIVAITGTLGFWLALAGVLGAVASPLGFRLGWWDFAFALRKLLAFAGIACLLGFVLCLIAWLASRATKTQLHAGLPVMLLLSGALSAYVLWHLQKVRSLPLIHDISTDTRDAPRFVALAQARRAAPNGIEYRGAQIAQQQQKAYPDIATLTSALAPAVLFARAEAAARAAGWEIAAADSPIAAASGGGAQEGRIEATATSALYGFKDDIVIRIRPAPAGSGSVADMRSMSRVGLSDLGMNAQRIRALIAALRE
jgi:hypothetical protein